MKINKNSKKAVSIPNFKIEQSNKIDITANSGLFLLAELMKKIELLEKLARLNIFQRQKIGEAAHILTLVLNQFTGGDAIYDTKNLKDDEALRAIFGDMHIPAPHTSGDFWSVLQKKPSKDCEKSSIRCRRSL